MKRIIYIFVVLVILSASSIYSQIQTDIEWPTLAISDWPMIKHDPQFTGRSPYKGPQTPTIVWTKDLNDGIFSGPVIGEEGNLYFGSYYQLDSADHFYSYTSDGNFRWDYKLGSNRPPQSGILIDSSNTIYFGSLDQYFYALNSDGTLKWRVETGYITEILISNIDLQGNLYITNNPEGELLSISPEGTINWRVKYEDGFLEKSPVFSPDGKTIYIAGRDSNLFAINIDGSLKWKFSCGRIRKAPVVDNQGNLYFLPNEVPQYFYSLNFSGDINWKNLIQNLGPFVSYSIPTIDFDSNIYLLAVDTLVIPNRSLLSFDYSGNLRWSYNFDEPSDDFWQPLICDSEGTVYVGSTFGYYYYAISSDGQLKWKLPLNDYQVDNTGTIAKDGTLYLGVHKSSIWNGAEKNLIAIRDTITTSVNDETLINNYKLEQNYPNPFNPTTTINYSLKESGFVQLKVYDVLGKEIATLLNEEKRQGSYSVKFNGNNLPSGIYFYTLRVNNFVQNRKMVLLR